LKKKDESSSSSDSEAPPPRPKTIGKVDAGKTQIAPVAKAKPASSSSDSEADSSTGKSPQKPPVPRLNGNVAKVGYIFLLQLGEGQFER
jgi:hypothetical protein